MFVDMDFFQLSARYKIQLDKNVLNMFLISESSKKYQLIQNQTWMINYTVPFMFYCEQNAPFMTSTDEVSHRFIFIDIR